MSYFNEYTISVSDATFNRICEDYDIVRAYDDDQYYEADALVYCSDIEDYVREHYYTCEDCGEYFYYSDSVHYIEYDGYYCDHCMEQMRGPIEDYHSNKGNYIFYGDGNKYIGYELEVDGGFDRANCAYDIQRILHDRVFFEEDGSLSDGGFEIISNPHTLEVFDELKIEEVMKICKNYGFTSHDSGNCGLHLHFSKAWFGDTCAEQSENIALVTKFYHHNFEIMKKLSRRDGTRYCEDENYDFANKSLDKVINDKKNSSRYSAVNLQPLDAHGTVEFRLGRGTLVYNTFMAWLDIHCAIANASKTAKNYDFLEWINPGTVKPETWEYIEKKLGLPLQKDGLKSFAIIDNGEVA